MAAADPRITARKARQTRAVYNLIGNCPVFYPPHVYPGGGFRALTLREMHREANAMWRTLGHRHADLVVRSPFVETSWADLDACEIVIARHHRDVIVLSHEVAHLHVGWAEEDDYGAHGPIFMETWQLLLARHASVDPWEFELQAMMHGAIMPAQLEDGVDHVHPTAPAVRSRRSVG